MKNIFKLLFVFAAVGALFVSCNKETNFEAQLGEMDANATYYIQFVDAAKTLETGISEAGELIEIETTVAVALMGAAQSTDIVVDFVFDPSTTITPSMYTLSATSITIPAGKTSASITLVTKAADMPIGENLKFVLTMDAGAHNSPAAAGLKIDYNMKRMEFCPWTVDEMVGTYTGTDESSYASAFMTGAKFEVFKVDDNTIAIAGLWQSVYGPNYWGETVTGGDRVEFTYKPNGKLTTTNQFLCQTEGVWDYYFGPSGGDIKWDGCVKSFDIPFFFHWDGGYEDNIASKSTLVKD